MLYGISTISKGHPKARARKYSPEVGKAYLAEQKINLKKTEKNGNKIFGLAFLATAIKGLVDTAKNYKPVKGIADDAIAAGKGIELPKNAFKKLTALFKQPLKVGFAPVIAPFKKLSEKTNADFGKIIEGKNVFKAMGNGFILGFKTTFRAIESMFKAMPKPVRVIAIAAFALNALNYSAKTAKIDGKYDQIQKSLNS